MAAEESPIAPAATDAVSDANDVRDVLPDDLDAHGYVGPYKFPDNSRRRWPGAIYVVMGSLCILAWALTEGRDAVLVNEGFLVAGVLLVLLGIYSITSGWHMTVDETGALVSATRAVGFPVGHASAQLAWRGLRSRPTWRILCYSAEEPPRQRGFVLVDAVDGRVVSQLVEANPEEWATG